MLSRNLDPLHEKACNPKSHSKVTPAGREVFMRTSGSTWEEALDSSGKIRKGSQERRHSGLSPSILSSGNHLPAEGPGGSQTWCPAFSAAGANQSEPLFPGHSHWLREGPKLSPAEISPRISCSGRKLSVFLNSGCWKDVMLELLAAISPLLPISVNTRLGGGGLKQGRESPYWAKFYIQGYLPLRHTLHS